MQWIQVAIITLNTANWNSFNLVVQLQGRQEEPGSKMGFGGLEMKNRKRERE